MTAFSQGVFDFCRLVPGRVGLLVSVRSATEACEALAGGAEVIDVKEPANGPMGRAENDAICEVVEAVAGRAPVTAALGELSEALDSTERLPAGLAVAKVGLAGQAGQDWPSRLAEFRERLTPECRLGCVVYADADRAGGPDPIDAAAGVARAGRDWLVVDTFDKQHAGVLAYQTAQQLTEVFATVGRAGLGSVLAGRLSLEAIPAAAATRPSLIGLRSAVCRGGRAGNLSAARVQAAAHRLAACRTLPA